MVGPFRYPPMPQLPKERVQKSKVFENISLDFLGPLHVKSESDQKSTVKVYVCLLTCMVTRACHLEMVRDMTAEQFLLALRRHMAIRSVPKHIYCDQAPQHILMDKVFQEAWKNVSNHQGVKTYMSDKGVIWHFTPAYSPWSRGFVEILVKSAKQALLRTIGKLTLSFDHLQTILCEVSAMLNSRPLTYTTDDIKSMYVLTPQEFMGLQYTGPPDLPTDLTDPDFTEKHSSREILLRFWKVGISHLDTIWQLWRNLYLQSLRERQNSMKQNRVFSKESPSINDIVLIHDSILPRGTWKIAKIISLDKSSDGEVRSATLKTPEGKEITRPINKLYPSECSNEKLEPPAPQVTSKNDVLTPPARPKRAAAQAAKQKISQIYGNANESDSD